jgi:hypothetical protein
MPGFVQADTILFDAVWQFHVGGTSANGPQFLALDRKFVTNFFLRGKHTGLKSHSFWGFGHTGFAAPEIDFAAKNAEIAKRLSLYVRVVGVVRSWKFRFCECNVMIKPATGREAAF